MDNDITPNHSPKPSTSSQ